MEQPDRAPARRRQHEPLSQTSRRPPLQPTPNRRSASGWRIFRPRSARRCASSASLGSGNSAAPSLLIGAGTLREFQGWLREREFVRWCDKSGECPVKYRMARYYIIAADLGDKCAPIAHLRRETVLALAKADAPLQSTIVHELNAGKSLSDKEIRRSMQRRKWDPARQDT